MNGPNAFCYAESKCFRIKFRGQRRKDKSIEQNDNVEVSIQQSKVGSTTNSSETIWQDNVKLGNRERRKGRKNKEGKKKRGKFAKFCLEDEVRQLDQTL